MKLDDNFARKIQPVIEFVAYQYGADIVDVAGVDNEGFMEMVLENRRGYTPARESGWTALATLDRAIAEEGWTKVLEFCTKRWRYV